MKKFLFIFGLFLFSIINSVCTLAQDTEFWFAFPDISENSSCGRFDYPWKIVVSNANNSEAHISIKMYNGVTVSQTIAAHGAYIHTYNVSDDIETLRSSAGNVVNYGFQITSDIKVTAYAMVTPPCNQDIWAFKGKNALGTEFYVPLIYDIYYKVGTQYGVKPYRQVDIVATEDGTTVNITPTTTIRIGISGTSPATTTISRTMNKGQTLKIMENTQNVSPSLGGSHITSDKPIAVTVTEDLLGYSGTGWDVAGDQLIPIDKLGLNYIVAKGYLAGTHNERIYMTGTASGTSVTVNNGSTTTSYTIGAGENKVYVFGSENVVSITSTKPIYIYQVTGARCTSDEIGSAYLPSLYSIGQKELSFYQAKNVASDVSRVVLTFQAGAESYFTYTCDGITSTLAVTPLSVPGYDDWKIAKVNLPTTGNGKVVTVKNEKSPFALGYYVLNFTNGGSSYGYLSAFGSFDFGADTIYQCTGGSTTLTGGYAKSYSWIYSPDSKGGPYTTLSDTTPSITVDKDGFYAILMDQDPNIVSDTIFIRTMNFDAKVQPLVSLKDTTSLLSASINPILTSDPKIEFTYDWAFEGATISSSACEAPVVTWTGIHRKATVHVTAEATTSEGTSVVCDTTINALFVNIEIEPVNKWPESEDGKPVWNPQYDKDNKCSWYGGCDMKFTMTLYPSLEDHDINLSYLGALKKSFILNSKGESLKDSYTMLQGDSLLVLYFSMTEDSITEANVGKLGAMEAEVVSYGRDTSDWFNLYTNPEYENIYVKPNLRSDKTVDFGITGGSPNLMRSINGRAWCNAYSALTAAEQLCLTDSAVIWLREPNGCWEAQLFFMSGIDPIITRYVDIPKVDGVTTVPEAGKHYVEGHDDFSFTASYAGGSPLKVMASGYYSGIDKELIGQNMDNGTYKYTIVQVTEPWDITFGPELASGTVGNETIDGTSVWSYKNMLYVNTEAGTIVRIYNVSGSLCKQFTASGSSICGESLQSGVYVVAVGDVRYKVVIR